MPERFSAAALTQFSESVLRAAGLPPAPAAAVASTLVDGDLLGHDTHGLALLKPYVQEIEKGGMAIAGEPTLISDRGASVLWDGGHLPGP